MADCNDTLRELDSYLAGELSEDAKSGVHKHLEGCVDCLQAFDFHAELKQVIAAKCGNDELPPGLVAKLEHCLQTDFDGDGIIGDVAPEPDDEPGVG
jgi:mycothiol system anti-sigma-R factor